MKSKKCPRASSSLGVKTRSHGCFWRMIYRCRWGCLKSSYGHPVLPIPTPRDASCPNGDSQRLLPIKQCLWCVVKGCRELTIAYCPKICSQRKQSCLCEAQCHIYEYLLHSIGVTVLPNCEKLILKINFTIIELFAFLSASE